MITPAYVQTMARYNTWQNANIYGAADKLSDGQRRENRGAFFGSIHATLNHLLWADQMWMVRFKVAPTPAPAARNIAEGLEQYARWDELSEARKALDAFIENWASRITPADLAGGLQWYAASAQRDMVTPMAIAVTHLFNHQTHHRGQAHCLITGLGGKPDRTDLPFVPGE
ncbi:MAG TPA: DinB family protein [Hyphomicrobium sp.]|nr:DinB family protein [Hyphomicrobium sp.]